MNPPNRQERKNYLDLSCFCTEVQNKKLIQYKIDVKADICEQDCTAVGLQRLLQYKINVEAYICKSDCTAAGRQRLLQYRIGIKSSYPQVELYCCRTLETAAVQNRRKEQLSASQIVPLQDVGNCCSTKSHKNHRPAVWPENCNTT